MDTEKKIVFRKVDRMPKEGDWVKRNEYVYDPFFEWKKNYINHWSDETYERTEETERWLPPYRNLYYHLGIDSKGVRVISDFWGNTPVDKRRYESGNIFKTELSALKVAKEIEQLLKGNTPTRKWSDEDMVKFGNLIYKNMSYGNVPEHNKYVKTTFELWRGQWIK